MNTLVETHHGFTQEQISVIKATIAPGATDDELALFLMVAQKTGLDPFSRQIYLSERRSKDPRTEQWITKKTPETTIDGFRCIAERSGEYEGQAGPFWCGPDGTWRDVWLDMEAMPSAAKVGVWRRGFREPVWGIALFDEYKQTKSDGKLNSMWAKMGANQIAKCAESLALRKAFPRDLSGMYSKEEMAQAEERASKLAPMEVAERQIAANNQRRIEQGKPAIVEANPTYEERHTALVMEANAMLDISPTGGDVLGSGISSLLSTDGGGKSEKSAPRKKGTISFEALKSFADVKKQLRAAGDKTDTLYYQCLDAAGCKHADELGTQAGREVYKAMLKVLRKLEQDEALRAELENHCLRIGASKFLDAVGVSGFTSVDEVMANATGTQLDALLRELKAIQ